MGEAKRRGTFEQRREQAIKGGRNNKRMTKAEMRAYRNAVLRRFLQLRYLDTINIIERINHGI